VGGVACVGGLLRGGVSLGVRSFPAKGGLWVWYESVLECK